MLRLSKKNFEDKRQRVATRILSRIQLNTIEVLISKALINSHISHDEFVSLNNV